MYCENIIDIIKKYEVKGSKFGLERTRNLLNALGSPDDNLKIIHVAGTNGKGSLCEYVSQILLAAGKRVGTFTSPEAYCYGEKFKINCDQIPDEKLKEYLSYVYTLSLKFEDKPTAFEIETATALYAFFKEGCEYAVVECGMGGLNDSTNAINKKQVAAITSVSLEHTAVLGKTISEICSQKAGIIKNCPAIVSAFQADEGLKFFSKLSVKFAGEGLSFTKICEDGQEFLYDGESYKIKMFGLAQAYNASVAIEVARALGIKLPYIKAGLERAQLSGRIEKIKRGGTTYILDGSHNPASFAPLLECVQNSTLSKTLVFGCLSDKDVDSIAKMLSEQFKKSYVFAPPSYRAMDGQKIYGMFSKYIKDTTLCKSVSDALAKANDELVVVCGSFTLLKEAKEWIEKRQ